MNFLDEGEQPSCHVCGAKMSREPPPKRIQRKRTKGWKMPENAVYVGRPTKWGNRWKPEQYWAAGYSGSLEVALRHCVDAFRAWISRKKHWAHGSPLESPPNVSELHGKDLACWCPLNQPCHADVLLEIANQNRIWKCSCGASTGVKD